MSPIEGRNVTLYAGLSKLGRGYKVQLMDWKNPDYDVIAKAGAVILAMGYNHDSEGEGHDKTYSLPEGQNEFILAVTKANPNTAVIVYSGGEIDVNPWLDKVNALIMGWYTGQEGGTAFAQLLSGKVSPSGRLPFTFWGTLEANHANYGISRPYGESKHTRHKKYPFIEYTEGIFLGYRGMEHFGEKPMFPIGYGLTYSKFEYSNLAVEAVEGGIQVQFVLRNAGKVAASEVAQVYISAKDSPVIKADLELAGYEKVALAPGKEINVSILLPRSAFSHYDVASHDWVMDAGTYNIRIGASATDVRLSQDINL